MDHGKGDRFTMSGRSLAGGQDRLQATASERQATGRATGSSHPLHPSLLPGAAQESIESGVIEPAPLGISHPGNTPK